MAITEDDMFYDDADISTAPFTSQPQFTRGLSRKPIKFVPEGHVEPAPPKKPGVITSEQYYAIVFAEYGGKPPTKTPKHPICPTCNGEMSEGNDTAHYLSITHQMSLPRNPIPSAMDRTRMGYKVLQKNGFDIDARVGLGARGEGILYPVIPKIKYDTFGIGVAEDKNEQVETNRKGEYVNQEKKKPEVKKAVRTDAAAVRKRYKDEKRRDAQLRREFYGNSDVEKYLNDLEGSRA